MRAGAHWCEGSYVDFLAGGFIARIEICPHTLVMGLMKRLSRYVLIIALSFGVLPGIFTAASAQASQSSCLATTDLVASFYPDDCTLPYSDSGNIIDKVDTCHNYSSLVQQDITNPGYDYLMAVRILGVTPSGEVRTPNSLNFTATMSNDCRLWNAYSLEGSLVDPLGNAYPITFTVGTLSSKSQTLNTDGYCFLQQLQSSCKWLDFGGSVSLPPTSQPGLYSVQIHVKSLDTLFGRPTGLSSIDLPMNWSHIINVSGGTPSPVVTPSEIPLTDISFNDSNGNLVCVMNDFTSAAVKTNGITGTHWRISSNVSGNTILDEYDLGLGVQANGDAIRSYTANGGKISMLYSDGVIRYAYSLRNQTAGIGYECSVAVNTDHGTGRYISKDLIAQQNVVDFNVTKTSQTTPSKVEKKRTITCVKGKMTKRVTAFIPVCTNGYRKK